MTSFAQLALRVPRFRSMDRRKRQPVLSDTCAAPTASHDGRDVRTYVLVRDDRRSLSRLCSGCVSVAQQVGLVYLDQRR